MKLSKWFLIIAAIYVAGFFAHAFVVQKTVYGDGIFYFSWLRSLVIDHDINFANEYTALGVTQQRTPTLLLGNIYAVGPALLWLPSYLWIHSTLRLEGFSFLYQVTVGLTGVLYVLAGLLLLYRTLHKFFSDTTCALTVTTVAATTNLLYYGSLDTVNSHALSFFASAVFMALLTQPKSESFYLGVCVGLLALIRPQDAILGIIYLPVLFSHLMKKNIYPVILFLTGTILAFLPQLLAWQILYGKFWASPYLARGYGFSLLDPHLLEVLFSPRNGLLLWSPVLFYALAGFMFRSFPKKINRWTILGAASLQLYLVASWTTWWQGASFGGRMFISLLPFFGLGLATLYTALQSLRMKPLTIMLSIIMPLTALNMLLILAFLLTN
ncbi:hypothetical protein HY948_02970 [Candidatus Gottesmanbacteria bacterium]|nr:hypothetical protein [Candidatus Gottesmanbacteria bacterium]